MDITVKEGVLSLLVISGLIVSGLIVFFLIPFPEAIENARFVAFVPAVIGGIIIIIRIKNAF